MLGRHYLSHSIFGLSTWTWRIPFLALYFLAWAVQFRHVARRAGAWAAFALCTSVSLTPLIVAYERTASNDALIGALLVLSYVCAAGGGLWRLVFAGLLSGAIILVKPSLWALLPIVAAGAMQDRRLQTCWRDLALLMGIAVTSAFAWKLVVALSVMPDAERAGVSVWEIVRRTTTHYPLPPLFDFVSHFKGLASFPRDPSIQILGVAVPLISSVPLAMAAKCLAEKRWNGRLLLFLAVPAYVAAVSVMNTIYTHYFLPVAVMLPIVAIAIASELEASCSGAERMAWRDALPPICVAAALCVAGGLFLAPHSFAPQECVGFYSRIYNLPSRNPWCMTWGMAGVFTVVLVLVIAVLKWGRCERKAIAVWTFSSLAAASTIFAAFPAVQIAGHIRRNAAEYFAPMIVSMAVSTAFLLFTFGVRKKVPWRNAIPAFVPLCILACYLSTPSWRSAFRELVRPGTRCHQTAARELARLLPTDAIVIGERSNQMLMSLPIRTATTFAANSDPIPVIASILKSEPNAKLYALVDSQHAYNLQHYREHAKEYRLRHIKTFKMPSFGTGAPSDVYLAAIEILSNSSNQP